MGGVEKKTPKKSSGQQQSLPREHTETKQTKQKKRAVGNCSPRNKLFKEQWATAALGKRKPQKAPHFLEPPSVDPAGLSLLRWADWHMDRIAWYAAASAGNDDNKGVV